MVPVLKIADSDAPSAISVPTDEFHISVTGAEHRCSVVCEYIGSFMDSQPSETAPCSPGTSVGVIVAQLDGKRFFRQPGGVEFLVDAGDMGDNIDSDRVLVIIPNSFPNLCIAPSFFHQIVGDGIKNIAVVFRIGFSIPVAVTPDAVEHPDRKGGLVIRIGIHHTGPQMGGNADVGYPAGGRILFLGMEIFFVLVHGRQEWPRKACQRLHCFKQMLAQLFLFLLGNFGGSLLRQWKHADKQNERE